MRRIIGAIIFVVIGSALFSQVKENVNYIDSVSVKIIGLNEVLIKIQDNYYAILTSGEAGNIGAFISEDGILLIDDQWSNLSNKIKEILSTITDKKVSAVINTHYHYDHTNGNLVFGQEKIPIVSHQNARQRMSEKQVLLTTLAWQISEGIVQKPYPAYALPSITFGDKMTFFKGTEKVELIYFKNAHSDGDIVVHFKNGNIFHTGDIFVTYGLPYIDENVGGNIYDMINAVERILLMSDDKTKFIPGHGPICTKKELEEYRNLLRIVLDNVEMMVKGNYRLEDILKDTREKIHYENTSGDKFIEQVYRTVKVHLSAAKN